MSFFHEPPPLDSEIPPPLDDKIRDNDFELEEDENIEDNPRFQFDLPELPTDFKVFSSLATDLSYSHPPPQLSSFETSSETPPDDDENNTNESPETCDVAEEKESLKIIEVTQIKLEDDGEKSERTSKCNEEAVVKCESVCDKNEEQVVSSTAVSEVNIPTEILSNTLGNKRDQIDVNMSEDSNEKESKHEADSDCELKIEFSKVFKTEEISKEDLDKDVEAQFKETREPIPQLFEDDDEFDVFETAIPIDRQIEKVANVEVKPEPSVEQFEADFSAFNAFSEFTAEKTFEPLKTVDFSTSSDQFKPSLQDFEDDDDDFGEFNDFTQAEEQAPNQLVLQPMALSNVNEIIDMMFSSSSLEDKSDDSSTDCAKEHKIIGSDNFVSKFNDFDSTLALGYLYTSSKARQSLVKALGIDTRNILLGQQWASSLSAPSNMPRFAANLSMNPIEPLKPTSSQSSTIKSSTEVQSSMLHTTKEVVPEAEFDWNSSGLVNPLDGSQPKPQQQHDVETIILPQPATTRPIENESPFNVVDQEVTQVFETAAKANAGNESELSDSSAYQWSNETGFSGHLASSNVLVRERTIKLPETHIFTPVKGTSPVAREVTSRDVSPAPGDVTNINFSKGTITVKEYHDVEYSLEPKKRLESDGDFDDFQSAQPTVNVNPPLVPLSVLEPKSIDKSSTEIKWPEPGNIAQSVNNDLDFLEEQIPSIKPASTTPKVNFNIPLAPTSTVSITPKKKEESFAQSIIGSATTEDDDFNDFQAAPLQKKPIQSNDPITLSPARLVATANKPSKQQSSWISSMDNDEVNRIEAAFPKCKTEKKTPQKNDDEDDWSEFVGASQSPTSLPFPQPPSTISSNVMNSSSRFQNGESDDWSDFVSVSPVPKMSTSKSFGAISSQFQSKPHFSSWSQPAKPYVNHTTSFLTSDSGSNSQKFSSSNYPYVTEKLPRHSMTITNNFNYNGIHHGIGAPGGSHQTKTNGISTILPELDFAMPKNFINLPRGGQIDPGKK